MEPPTEPDRRTKDQFLPELLSLLPLCNASQHNHDQDEITFSPCAQTGDTSQTMKGMLSLLGDCSA